MKKKEFNPIIQTTRNYAMFKLIGGNRELNHINLKRLEVSMSETPLVSIIMVNERNEIIDGQHRFEVCKRLGLPINYLINSMIQNIPHLI